MPRTQEQPAEAKKNDIMKRQMIVYPKPKYHTLTVGYCLGSCLPKSAFLDILIRSFFDKMSPQELANLQRSYDEATEEERNNPAGKKVWKRR